MFRTPALLRSALPTTSRVSTRSAAAAASRFQQTRQAHAISNPTLANIEKRWEAMPPQEQAELWMALRDRMSADWNELTLQEKKAGTFGIPPIRRRGGCGNVYNALSWTNAACFSLECSTRYMQHEPWARNGT
jgi:hypothetical protein